MSVRLEYEWENPQGALGKELRATWASLLIRVDDAVVTAVEDLKARANRGRIYLPLYPLAEWIATHWWFLQSEYESPRRRDPERYGHRHNLRYGREGFAFPELCVIPSGDRTQIQWQPSRLQSSTVRFLNSGESTVETAEVVEALRSFVSGVVGRLEIEEIDGTLLQTEWAAIQTATEEEREFLHVAAALGLDPYSISPEDEARILNAHEGLPVDLVVDFFASTAPDVLEADAGNTREAIDELKSMRGGNGRLQELREAVALPPPSTPWKEGYRVAQELRTRMGIEDAVLHTLPQVFAVFGVCEDGGVRYRTARTPFDALLATQGPARIIIDRASDAGRKFALCRGVFEYLTARNREYAAVSSVRSERQQRNRAFAAEFLVPARQLKALVRSGAVTEDEIEAISEEFGVSAYVVRYQVENHRLATVLD